MAKEKTRVELAEERGQLYKKGVDLVNKAKQEKRELSKEEKDQITEIQLRMTEINLELAQRDAMKFADEHTTGEKFSLRKALLELADGGHYSENIRKMNERGEASLRMSGILPKSGTSLIIPVESRAEITAGTAGTNVIETDFMNIVEPLRDRLVLAQAGATMLTGLVSNIDVPSYSGSTSNWAEENEDAEDGAGTFSKKSMKPKRLTSILRVSRQMLVQDSLGVEAMLRADLINSIASKLEATILGGAETSAEKPDGLFTGYVTASEALSWKGVVNLETTVDLANALMGNTKYIVHTSLVGLAKTTLKKDGVSGYIMSENGQMNGYDTLRTNAVYKKSGTEWGALFGNWADLLIGQWGALDLTVDPYTEADKAFVRIIVNSYWDSCLRRDNSIAKALFKDGSAA